VSIYLKIIGEFRLFTAVLKSRRNVVRSYLHRSKTSIVFQRLHLVALIHAKLSLGGSYSLSQGTSRLASSSVTDATGQ